MTRKGKRIILVTFVAACIGIFMYLPLQAGAGQLDPPTEAADGSGNPLPTMKTLNEIPPTWSQIIPTSERFVTVLAGNGILDRETGLVWASEVFTSNQVLFESDWAQALRICNNYFGQNQPYRRGWHLPSAEEFLSLASPTMSTGGGSGLPLGFFDDANILGGEFWLANDSNIPGYNMTGGVNADNYMWIGSSLRTDTLRVWCVRGGTGRLSNF